MIRIELGEKSYNIASKFDELNIKTYQNLSLIDADDERKKMVGYLQVLTGLDYKEIEKIEISQLIILMDKFKFFDTPEQELVEAVEVDGDVYVFDKNLQDMRFDMFVDLEEITKDKDLIIENLHLIMAILYRPACVKKKKRKLVPEPYDSDTVMDRAEFFKEYMMMDKILGALFFFTISNLNYIQDLEVFLTKKKEEKSKMKENILNQKPKASIENGAGI
jgi:hypothetical protein